MSETQADKDRRLGAFADVDATDADDFIGRLDEMHGVAAFKAYKRDSFAQMRLAPGMAVADIGCGTGEDAAALAAIVGPSGNVTGVDISEAMVTSARERHHATAGLSFMQGGADRLDFADGILDAIRADRVLIHVPDPGAAIDEMLRVLRPGGRIVITEPDMPSFWVASDDHQITEAIVRAIAGSCRHPFLPRDVWALLQDRGLDNISCSIRAITAHEIDAIDRVLDLKAVSGMVAQAGIVEPGCVDGWLSDVMTRAQNGRFMAALSILMAAATKP